MLLGVIADDFTGASDIANTLAKGGLSTTQFLGLQTEAAPRTCEAGVVALKSRSIPARDAIDQSLRALDWLMAQGCQQFIFKYCSTFDSTRDGNIGPVGQVLARKLGVYGVVACPAFPTAKRTVFQGHLFVGDKLLNESGLENHPLNPMTDADIRRWLREQSSEAVGWVPWATVTAGAENVRTALQEAAARKERLVVVDAVSDDDLLKIAIACDDARIITGGSGIALGLPLNFIKRGLAKGGQGEFRPVQGPEAILAGSCSVATLGQIEVHRKSHPAMPISVSDVMSGRVQPKDVVKFATQNVGNKPIAFSSDTPERVRQIQQEFGRDSVAQALDSFFSNAAAMLVASGIRRLVVAGGETSGAVITGLNLQAVSIGPEIDPGVPALSAAEGKPLAIALKSGNFGGQDFFERALRTLEGSR